MQEHLSRYFLHPLKLTRKQIVNIHRMGIKGLLHKYISQRNGRIDALINCELLMRVKLTARTHFLTMLVIWV